MPKRIGRSNRTTIFPISRSNDPITNLLSAGANIVVSHGLKRLSREVGGLLGTNGPSAQDQIALNSSRIQLQKQETEYIRVKALTERQIRLLDLRIEDKQIEVERARAAMESAQAQAAQLQFPVTTEVISGALEVTADPKGISGSPEQAEAYARWLDGFQEGKVVLICGKRGSGKSVLAAKMGEFMMATYRMPCYWVGLPDGAKSLIPNWIKIVDDPHKCPVNSFIICDEAGISFLSLLFNTSRNRFLRALLMVARQRHCSLVFCVQNTTDVDISVVRQADSLVFKQPGLHQPETERPNIRSRARKAASAFSSMTRDEALETAFIFDDDFEGLIKSTPPAFWSEALSHAYSSLDLNEIEQQVVRKNELKIIAVSETRQLDDASLDTRILEKRKEGHGIETIANMVGCSDYRVRKLLDSVEKGKG